MNREEYWDSVEKSEDGCWEWTGATTKAGYGRVWFDNKSQPAHRISYEEEHGELREGQEIDHLCHNRTCVRVSHLEAVTRAENMRRTAGEDRSTAIRSADTIEETETERGLEKVGKGGGGISWHESPKILQRMEVAWSLYQNGLSMRQIGGRLGVGHNTVRRDISRSLTLIRERTEATIANTQVRAVSMREQIHQELMSSLYAVRMLGVYNVATGERIASPDVVSEERQILAEIRKNADGFEKLLGLVGSDNVSGNTFAPTLQIAINAKGEMEFIDVKATEVD